MLARRRLNFRHMAEHVSQFGQCFIVETGTAWDEENWDGQGQSTRVFDWVAEFLKRGKTSVVSIDIRKEASDYARKHTQNVDYIIGDSVSTLSKFQFPEQIGLLYLDSFDWTQDLNLQSAFHHMMELATVWAKLPSGCMVVVDDRHGDGKGKHWAVEGFMQTLGIEPAFKNHQMGWIKP